MSAPQRIICIDVGGSYIKVRGYALSPSGQPIPITGEWRAPVTAKATQDFKADFGEVIRLVDKVDAEIGGCDGLSLAVAGLPTLDGKTLVRAGNIVDWVAKPFVQMLEDRYGVPVLLSNDAQASLAADLLAFGSQGALGLYVGTGLGVATSLLIDGKLFIIPGEGSHGTVDMHGKNLGDCGCGQRGGPCVESHGSGRALALDHQGKEPEGLTDEQVFLALVPSLVALTRTVVNLFIPRVGLVVIGGGITAKRPDLVIAVRNELLLQLNGAADVTVEASPYGEETGPYGAAAYWQMSTAA